MSAFDFARLVPDNGYSWWYLDAVSDDGRYGITIIAFIGSVFSPYYRWARNRNSNGVDPRAHCAFNVALYGPGRRWSMTERGAEALGCDDGFFRIGPSHLTWDGQRLIAQVDEWAAPLPKRVRGRVEIEPAAITESDYLLDAGDHHRWHPIAPIGRARVVFDTPGLDWAGHAYIDHNRGSRPLETDFIDWQWSRAASSDNAVIHYDTRRTDASRQLLALAFDRHGRATTQPVSGPYDLAPTRWRMPRAVYDDADARIAATLEDTPFYARSTIDTIQNTRPVRAVHESLSMTRFTQPWVQAMLGFRMPRRKHWRRDSSVRE